jgi:hypothetical protein
MARKNEISAYLLIWMIKKAPRERVGEVDLMSSRRRSNVLHRAARQWAGRMKSLAQIAEKIAVAAARTLQRALNHQNGTLVPVPVRVVVDRRRHDRRQRRD